jgi:hypothetical protein
MHEVRITSRAEIVKQNPRRRVNPIESGLNMNQLWMNGSASVTKRIVRICRLAASCFRVKGVRLPRNPQQ